MPEVGDVLQIGKGRIVGEGSDVAFLSFGAHLSEVQAAARLLEQDGLSATIADARFAKPLDMELIRQLARHHRALICVEQGAQGGFGAMVLHALAAEGAFDTGLSIRTLTLPDRFIDQASPDEMYLDAELTRQDIAKAARQALGVEAKIVSLHRG